MILTIVLILTGSTSSCKNDDIDISKIDFSNIEDLYAQPLPVIQKCVEGRWQWTEICTWGVVGEFRLTHTFVDITKDSVIVTQNGYDPAHLDNRFSYSWKKKKTLSDYTSYVMWNNEQKSGEWYFDKIQNDSLFVHSYNANPGGFSNSYLFLRVK